MKQIFALGAALLLAAMVFFTSHRTHFRYDDWLVLNSDIQQIQQLYGDFDLGRVVPGSSGRVGYFIYKDNRGIMPDYLDHYYYIEYAADGTVLRVFDGCSPGG